MKIGITVTEITGNDIIVTSEETIITTQTMFIGDALNIPCGDISGLTATNIQDALSELADRKFAQDSAPTSEGSNLAEGDIWYNTVEDKLMVYRNTTWEEITLSSQLSEGSSESEYEDVSLHGGTF